MTLQNSSDAKIEVIRQQQQQLPCSYIDAQGREVQITEKMIQQACSELEQRLVKPAQQG
ncbi:MULTISPECIES: PA1571 family protein [unclassified Pseudomonas]|uniref:PA1571 family protein n=1 Tax=unclassified Pseudomonas TaxID=196821 RepID=UPI001562922A|nr:MULTISPECIES: PA1571 family protein [unclassified Pseudomonas]